jgi:hypothetical protein
MSILDFQRFIRSEDAASRLIHRYRFGGDRPPVQGRLPIAVCPQCETPHAYRLAEGRWRCGSCHYTFGTTTGTWLGLCRLPAATWLWLIKLFELELVAQRAGL